MPKSVTFARPSESMRTFWGFTSRWTSLRRVGGGEPAPDLDRVGGRLVDRQPAQPLDPLLQRLALDVLEDDVGVAAVLAGVDHGDDVGMGELGDRARLATEALDLVGLVGHLAVHDLHRDPALERLVARQVDRGHPAAAQLGLEPVAPREYGADQAACKPGCRFVRHSIVFSTLTLSPRPSRCSLHANARSRPLLHRSGLPVLLGQRAPASAAMWEFGDGLRFSWVMGGLARSYGPDYRDDRVRGRRGQEPATPT